MEEKKMQEPGCTCGPSGTEDNPVLGNYAGCPVHDPNAHSFDEELVRQLKAIKEKKIYTSLTPVQKLNAISLKYYNGGTQWIPKTGDYYTSCRADLELYQIVETNDTVVKTRYFDPVKDTIVSEWPIETFLKDFGLNRVYVPEIILTTPLPDTYYSSLTSDLEELRRENAELKSALITANKIINDLQDGENGNPD